MGFTPKNVQEFAFCPLNKVEDPGLN